MKIMQKIKPRLKAYFFPGKSFNITNIFFQIFNKNKKVKYYIPS